MATVYEEREKVFKALCDERRQRILELLHSGEKCACVLIDEMDMPQSSLSYHMKILCDSGIVTSREEGKWTHYQISRQGRKGGRQCRCKRRSFQGKTEESCAGGEDHPAGRTSRNRKEHDSAGIRR